MRCFSYVITRDYGFAPNPFGGYCTLATCMPTVRNHAVVGDWVIGCGSKKNMLSGRMIYAMQVSEKLTFEEYWEDDRFQHKKPIMNGSLLQLYGDNIYCAKDGQWKQLDSHHSHEDGSTNYLNLNKDTSQNSVLISNLFYYFGCSPIELPDEFKDVIIMTTRNYKNPRIEALSLLITFLKDNYEPGILNFPQKFHQFKRYGGIG